MHQEETYHYAVKPLNAISGDLREILMVKFEETAKRASLPGRENNCRSF